MLRRYREGFLQGSSLLWMGQLFSAHSGAPVPAERPCSAKKEGQTEPRCSARADNACLYEAFPFRGDQQAPGYLGRPYAPTRPELLLPHQTFSSGHGPPPFNPMTGPAWPGTARLRAAEGPPGRCWWAWCPSAGCTASGTLTVTCEPADRALVWGGAWWSNVARRLWSCAGGHRGSTLRRRGRESWMPLLCLSAGAKTGAYRRSIRT